MSSCVQLLRCSHSCIAPMHTTLTAQNVHCADRDSSVVRYLNVHVFAPNSENGTICAIFSMNVAPSIVACLYLWCAYVLRANSRHVHQLLQLCLVVTRTRDWQLAIRTTDHSLYKLSGRALQSANYTHTHTQSRASNHLVSACIICNSSPCIQFG